MNDSSNNDNRHLPDRNVTKAGRVFRILKARSPEDYQAAEALFREYIASLNFSVEFQNVTNELANLEMIYGPPNGALWMAKTSEGDWCGAVGMKRLDPETCEMKRLYIVPLYRGFGIGKLLSERLIEEARITGYKKMVLDTMPDQMQSAVGIYRKLGFVEREPYYANPLAGVMYMEFQLEKASI